MTQASTSCPASPVAISGLPGSLLNVNVVVQAADSFDQFAVWVGADLSVIKPVRVELTGTVLPGAVTKLQCLGDCTHWLSGGPGAVAEEAAGQATGNQVTGLLFSVIYRVVGNITSSTPISLYYTVSPSGWVTGRAYLHFTGECDTMDCLFVPVAGATFRAGPVPLVQSANGMFGDAVLSIERSWLLLCVLTAALVTLSLLILRSRRFPFLRKVCNLTS